MLILPCVWLAGCSSGDGFKRGKNGAPAVADENYVRTPPPVLLAEYVGENQVVNEDAGRKGLVDMTNVSKGYVAVQCTAPVRTRVRITKNEGGNELIDDYTLPNDGTFTFYPITRGDGQYTITLFIFLEDSPQGARYERFIEATADVTLENEFGPFLVQSEIVNYNENSACVKLSHEITSNSSTNLEVVQQVYDWIAKNIVYDTAKAEQLVGTSVEYVPNPDETLRTKTGICYDYASLAAAMLRANGIPTKLIKGDVMAGDAGYVYHAWNMIWLEESGWIAVELSVNPNDWTRIDTTFAASGPDMGKFIGDGNNYTPISEY